MVRAMLGNPISLTELIERIRPGIAVSAGLHAALFLGLAYLLAFEPTVAPPAKREETKITMIDIPPPTTKVTQPTKPLKFAITPTIDDIHTDQRPIKVPPLTNFERTRTTVVIERPPAPEIIRDPKPIFRGGLIYPEVAADRGIPGYVDFSFVIEPDGTVGNPQVIAEEPDGYGFAAAAKKAFAKWRFEPRYVNGKAVAWPAQIRVSFKLR